MDGFMRALVSVWTDSGFAALTWENVVMILVGLVLLYWQSQKNMNLFCFCQSHSAILWLTSRTPALKPIWAL